MINKDVNREFYKRENNNFDLIRMVAAYSVIYAHSYAIQPDGGGDLITKITKVTHAGQLSVFVFIFFSGVFLFTTLQKIQRMRDYWIKKIMRIYPLLVLTLILTILMGAVFTTLPVKEYFSDPLTRTYFIKNFLNIENAHELPGVFANHHYSGVNGVLWYVTFIARLYLIGGILRCTGLFATKERMNVCLLIFLAWVSVAPSSVPLLGGNPALYGNPDFTQYTITVLIAFLICNNFPTLRVRWYVVVIGLIICLTQKDFTYNNTMILWAILDICFALWVGCSKIIKKVKILDVSYEVFLFGWPTSQVVCELNPDFTPIKNTILTIAITTWIGLLLHYTVENWFDKITNKILKR